MRLGPLIVLLCFSSLLQAQGGFQAFMPFDSSATANAVLQLPNGGYVLAGNQYQSNNIERTDGFVAFFDADGNFIKRLQFGGNYMEYVEALSLGPTGIAVAGTSRSTDFLGNAFLYLLSFDGDSLLYREYGGSGSESVFDILYHEGYYYLCGWYDTDLPASNAYLLKLDSSGEEVWTKGYGGPSSEQLSKLEISSDGKLIGVGHSRSYAVHTYDDGYAVKLDTEGNLLWEQRYTYGQRDGIERFLSVTENEEGDYWIGGYNSCSFCDTFYTATPWLLEINGESGEKLSDIRFLEPHWKHLHNPEWIFWFVNYEGGAFETLDMLEGDLVAGGFYIDSSHLSVHSYLLRFTPAGDVVWRREFGGAETDYLFDMVRTQDGGYALGGSYGKPEIIDNSDAWLVKVDEHGCLHAGCHIYTSLPPLPSYELRAYPNPAVEYFNLELDGYSGPAPDFYLYDMQGRLLQQQAMPASSLQIEVGHLSPGLYVYELRSSNQLLFSNKVVVGN